jgi:hypothetical protein
MTSTDKHVSMTFMRANPPTTGHAKVVKQVIDHAAANKGSPHVFLSHSQDSKKNPLTHSQKVHFLSKMAPGAHVHTETGVKTPIDALKHLHKHGATHVTMFVGSDRHADMSNLVHKYNGKEYKFKHLEVKSAGDRDPDADGVSGMSASKMRDHAAKKDFNSFKKGVAKPELAKDLYKATRKGMNLEAFQAVFLVGGPGSGKDFILREALADPTVREVPLAKMADRPPVIDEPLIVNGNAFDYDNIIVEAARLADIGYQVAMVFVYTSDAYSKARNEERIQNGEKTISEATRAAKYSASIDAMLRYKDIFGEGFFLFDNSADYRTIDEAVKAQVDGWMDELVEAVSSYFEKPVLGIAAPKVPKPVGGEPKGGHPVPKGYKRVKDGSFYKLVKDEIKENILRKNMRHGQTVGPDACPDCGGTGDDPDGHECVTCDGGGTAKELVAQDADASPQNEELNDLFERSMIDMIASKGPKKDAQKYEGGIAVPGDKAKANGESEVVESNQEVEVPQDSKVKDKPKGPKKAARPPAEPYNSNIGQVPSGGIGLTGYKVEQTLHNTPKSFSSIRRKSS